jgi:hypothetical protein
MNISLGGLVTKSNGFILLSVVTCVVVGILPASIGVAILSGVVAGVVVSKII